MIASPERQALSAFLTRLGDPPLEAEVEDYLSRALRDADDSESQELRRAGACAAPRARPVLALTVGRAPCSELVAGFSPGFAGLPASQQHVLMADLLKGVRAAEEEQPRPTATARSQQHVAGTTDISGNLASDLLPRLSSLAGGSSDNATSVAAGRPHQGDVVAGPVAAPVGMQQHVVETLHELCPLPHVDADFLLHVFLKKGCSLEVSEQGGSTWSRHVLLGAATCARELPGTHAGSRGLDARVLKLRGSA